MAQVRVRLQTSRVELHFEGTEEVFERQVEPLLRHLARAGARRPASAPPSATSAPRAIREEAEAWEPEALHFRTFRRQLATEPEGTDERIAAYAFYLWNYEKRETFSATELAGCFRADGAEAPDDLEAPCSDLERRRILQPAAHEGTWRLTPRGTNRVRKLLR